MYEYRKMTAEQRVQVLENRKARGYPLHAPPRSPYEAGDYLITAACYEHKAIFADPDDLTRLSHELLDTFRDAQFTCFAWVCLPNHYHALLRIADRPAASEILRKCHSRISNAINKRQQARGRQVWYRFTDRLMRSERQFWATINYIHNNPVKHQYIAEMNDWPWSSLYEYREYYGEQWMEQVWGLYPVYDYGKGWDW